jgi:hypothetical protein
VSKADFVEKINNHLEPEPFVECGECGRLNHKICAMWHDGLDRRVLCVYCRKTSLEKSREVERRRDRFSAKRTCDLVVIAL